ncbi:hypothetical protein [Agrobacterium rubi]|uniref:hypothetical protein n=1 Tax=Agrobacterium rubi TaxID=28099 RepID=UPI00201B738C|nr:hypothetical protein [Agrobacterium rubi]
MTSDLERISKKYIDDGNVADAIKIYLFMSDGDPSLDAGYLESGWAFATSR